MGMRLGWVPLQRNERCKQAVCHGYKYDEAVTGTTCSFNGWPRSGCIERARRSRDHAAAPWRSDFACSVKETDRRRCHCLVPNAKGLGNFRLAACCCASSYASVELHHQVRIHRLTGLALRSEQCSTRVLELHNWQRVSFTLTAYIPPCQSTMPARVRTVD